MPTGASGRRSFNLLVLSTPNASSWKKLLQVSNGVPEYDSPTFSGSWGHRYEYSYYTMQELLFRSGYRIVEDFARNVYFDDPSGFTSFIEQSFVLAGKVLTGQWRRSVKLVLRRGAGLFFVAQRDGATPVIPESEFLRI